ncbi:MAG: insulinase family protein, partial [Trueperaceae bacterium]
AWREREARDGDAGGAGQTDPRGQRTVPVVQAGHGRVIVPGLRRVHAALMAPGVGHADPERIAAALTAQVLGEPGHGQLHWALVDAGLAESAGLQHEPGDGFGTFGGWYACTPRDQERVHGVFVEVLQRAQEAAVRGDAASLDPEAWNRAARTLATDVLLQAERPDGRLDPLAEAWAARGELHDPSEIADRVLATPVQAGAALLTRRPFDTLAVATVAGPAA